MEPPRTNVPAGHGLTGHDTLRLAATAAALLLAVLSRGDALLLALLLAVGAWRPLPVVAIGAALAATSWRWGSTSLEAISGAQAVLGPGGWVGPASAAASSWLAALAVVVAATRPLEVQGMGASDRRVGAPNLGGVVLALTAGATAAVIVAGPAPGGALAARIVAIVVASVIAVVVSLARARTSRVQPVLDITAAGAGVAALGLATADAPPWDGTIATTVEGVALALAAVALVAVGKAAMGARRA